MPQSQTVSRSTAAITERKINVLTENAAARKGRGVQNVLNWMTAFDNYNNGLIGPGHCN